jgi:hypothetical protein
MLDLDRRAVVRTLGECHTCVFDRNGSRIKRRSPASTRSTRFRPRARG